MKFLDHADIMTRSSISNKKIENPTLMHILSKEYDEVPIMMN